MKKIVHVCLGVVFFDGYGYQENLLTKYHRYMGYQVSVIANRQSSIKNGVPVWTAAKSYENEDGVKVIRLPYLIHTSLFRKLQVFKNVYKTLCDESPDILFVHNCQFLSVMSVIRYCKKHPEVKVFVDNHADLENSATNWLSKNILHKIIWRYCAKRLLPYAERFYGVLPARVDFLTDEYGLPKEKVSLLVMGADDEKIEETLRSGARERLRAEWGVKNEFLIISGGKIDHNKPETLDLMRAMKLFDDQSVKLVVFGEAEPEFKAEFDAICQQENIIYIGWIPSDRIYEYYDACDLAVFPGKHSVLWEQAVGFGLPCIFRKIPGFDHVDVGGNCRFLSDVRPEAIAGAIRETLADSEGYETMRRVAREHGREIFSYRSIAERSIRSE